jgi:hypothetical protein
MDDTVGLHPMAQIRAPVMLRLMNEKLPKLQSSPPPLDFSVHGVWQEMKDFAHREPLTAVAAVATAGLLIRLVPNRWLVTVGSVVGSALLRPAILSLAVTKAMELCFPPTPPQPQPPT